MVRRQTYGYSSSGLRLGPGNLRGIIRILVVVNFSIWLLEFLFNLQPIFNQLFGLVPRYVWSHLFLWQPFTYMFMHGGLFHVLINMFVLWMFGTEIESLWGSKKFLKYYFLTGVGAGIVTLIFTPNSLIPVVGASGAIYGVLLAFALIYPNRLIFLYFIFPIRAKYFALLMGLIEFMSTVNHSGGGISNITHLSGLIIGYIYLRRYTIREKLRGFIRIEKHSSDKEYKPDLKTHHKNTFPGIDEDDLRRRVDQLLDKISEVGYDNLSDEEKQILFKASAYFSTKKDEENGD